MQNRLSDQELTEQLSHVYKDFLQNDDEYYSKIKQIAIENIDSTRLIIELGDLRRISDELPQKIIEDPYLYVSPFEDVMKDLIGLEREIGKGLTKASHLNPRIGFSGWFGRNHLTPRGLSSKNVNQMVCVEGIVSQCSIVKPKLVKSVHVSRAHLIGKEKNNENSSNTYVEVRGHRDISCLVKDRYLQSGVPTEDSQGNKMEVEIGLCSYKDSQKLILQELPEMIPTGQLPRSVEVIVEDDLVESTKPGDRIKIVGVYKPLGKKDGGSITGIFKVIIIANNIQLLNKNVSSPDISPQEIKIMKEISSRNDTFDLLSRSFASSLCGHEYVKKGLLLGILGGAEHNLENGTHIRGDIHTLLIGEPSCGKSQLLRFVMLIAPLAISTTGRGCSGVGLTAAVTHDPETKERRLEAGATVLADRGIVCIDEFDKMSFSDRVSIHEVMEQQRVTIAKAGIQASLNARCSIFAAANPVYGQFDDRIELNKQISFPDSLLSRFDLIFVIRDSKTPEHDRRIAAQVLAQVRFNKSISTDKPDKSNNIVIQPEINEDGTYDTNDINNIWQIPSYKHTNRSDKSKDASDKVKILKMSFLRKYIHYCKYVRNVPRISDEAAELVAKIFTGLRVKCLNKFNGTSVCTTRTLEGIIRLATAHAKLKMRDLVTPEDVTVAFELLNYSLFGEVGGIDFLNNEVFEDNENDINRVEDVTRNKKREQKIHKRKNNDESEDSLVAPPPTSTVTPSRELNFREFTERGHQVALAAADILRENSVNSDGQRSQTEKIKVITALIAEHFSDSGLEAIPEAELCFIIFEKLSKIESSHEITYDDIKEVIKMLEKENKIMIVNNTVYSIV
ncbi:replication origin activator 2 [Cryptosporidium ryanae]|uniref:replication origin activator 2 n=1 Tax=Cryptosporidium ryanae TaxID=515981 RepID=UPI00351A3955|nr:replication origin activator 2 [Cryptosporidium ryanae]